MSGGECLVLIASLFASKLAGVYSDLFVVLLKGSQILTSLGELSLLHALSDIPVDEGALGVHQVELVVQAGPGLSDSCGVGQHADGTLNLGQVTTRHNSGWLVVDADLESSGTPVNKLDGPLGLDGSDGSIDILGDNVAPVEEATGHVLAMTRVTLDHLVGWLEAGIGDLGNRKLLMVGLLRRDDWCIGHQWEVDTGVGHQVGLELSQINIEGTIKTKGGSDGGDNLANQPVEVGVGGALNVQVPAADVIDGLIVYHKCTVRVFQGGVGGQDGIVGLNNSSGDLWGWVDGELQLGLLSIIHGQALHEEGGEAGSSATTKGVEQQEALKSSTLVSQLADTIQNQVDNFLSNSVVSTGVVVGGILLSSDQLLWVEELSVGTSADFIDDSGLQINKYCSWDVLASTSLGKEGGEGVVSTHHFVRRHLAVRLDAMLQAVELPAGVTDLATGLANVDGDTFPHFGDRVFVFRGG